jgi:hypothetical protein
MVESGVVADEMFVVEVDHRSGEATDIIVTVSVGWSGRTIGRGRLAVAGGRRQPTIGGLR